MRMRLSADIPLSEPNVDSGLITWLSIDIFPDDAPESAAPIGHATVARIHIGNALDSSESILDALDADSGELEALYDVFFEDNWLKDEYLEGSGPDLLYVSEIDLAPAHQTRNVDLALVRRLCDTLGQGCAIAVIPYASQADIDHFTQLGCEVSTPGAPEGYLHLPLGNRTARVDDPDQPGVFKILPNPSPEGVETHH